MSVDWFKPLFGIESENPEIDVYQMPQTLGDDWAWAAAGVISDGYPSEAEARVAAVWYLNGLGSLDSHSTEDERSV